MATTIKGSPITLYRNGHSITVHPIDAQAWRVNGYTEDPDNVVEEVAEEVADKPEGKESKKAKADKQEGKDAA